MIGIGKVKVLWDSKACMFCRKDLKWYMRKKNFQGAKVCLNCLRKYSIKNLHDYKQAEEVLFKVLDNFNNL